ncbi:MULTISPECIES: cation diffusion facilitator family transporter [unclassified Cryobacterium]|uniref:cation diffusion facilitator family transporter n=1 Tax=unclassified Cryobacterium TaxID=2649013 RepID=UPI00106CD0C4|nr:MULTISPECIES: cation diffusion facilitator family transporter [unclassified Cryobacterium]TFB92088.1 cation transporter [Cryobacterium sp. MDB2-A-1]TFC15444.1 cation transporter [Cryobacterium sp. MDB2-A-2]TFC20140.1 cation transporter [Cryobacterium sp. MDB2-10]
MTEHDHAPAGASGRRRLVIAFGITSTILVAEVIGAILTGSLALLIDAAHMLVDAGGLLIALVAATLVTRAATARRTWGYARAEVLAATVQAAVLLAVGIFVFVEGIQRLIAPPEIASGQLLVFGVIGLVGNVTSITVLASGRDSSFNLRAAFLEVVNDALGSVAVIVAAIVIAMTGWTRADAVVAMLIGVLILPRTFTLLRETVDVLLEFAPRGLDLDSVRSHILELPHVRAVHDLHATQIATGLPVLTAHVVVDDECFYDGRASTIIDDLQNCVAEHFEISVEHSTFQLERAVHAEHENHTHK